jgi:hypothetical protein
MVFATPLTGPFDWADQGFDRMRLYERFDQLGDDARVEQDVEGLDVRWAVLCTGFIRDWQTRAPGLDDLASAPSAHQVFDNGAVRLYRIGRPTPATAG